MDINWFSDLVEIARQGSFSKAATARNMSVSSLSRRIQLLEDWASLPLLDRSSHPVRLTAAGEKLRPVAQAVIWEIDKVRSQLRGTHKQSDPVRFLAPHAVSVAIFPRLLALLQADAGALPVSLIPANFREVTQRFQQGDADFALYYVCKLFTPRLSLGPFESMLIAHDALVPVARDTAAATGSSRGVVRGVLLDEASFLGQVAKAAMLHHQVAYEASVTGSQILAIRQLAVEGAGVAWLPASLVAEDIAASRLERVLPEVPAVPFSVHVARCDGDLTPAQAQVWAIFKEMASSDRVLHFEKPFAQIKM
jgi:DNA-binding transcriptional LysR family regulator